MAKLTRTGVRSGSRPKSYLGAKDRSWDFNPADRWLRCEGDLELSEARGVEQAKL